MCVVLQEKQGLRVFESGGQGEVFGSKDRGVTGNWKKLIENFTDFTAEKILLG